MSFVFPRNFWRQSAVWSYKRMIQTSIASFFKTKTITNPPKPSESNPPQYSPTSVVELSIMDEIPDDVTAQRESEY